MPGGITDLLRPFVKKSVRVEVWGVPLADSTFEIDSAYRFGAGLLIFLRSASGGRRTLLKVAQPKSASISEDRVEISDARYVQWAGRKLERTAGIIAVVIAVQR